MIVVIPLLFALHYSSSSFVLDIIDWDSDRPVTGSFGPLSTQFEIPARSYSLLHTPTGSCSFLFTSLRNCSLFYLFRLRCWPPSRRKIWPRRRAKSKHTQRRKCAAALRVSRVKTIHPTPFLFKHFHNRYGQKKDDLFSLQIDFQ
jgi:hypothetical protein